MKVEHQFKNCLVYIDTEDMSGWHVPGFSRVYFPDGTYSDARPHTFDSYMQITEWAGYRQNVGAYCVTHELAHTFCSEALGLPYSLVVWASAHKVPLFRGMISAEERAVQAFQRLAMTGERDDKALRTFTDNGIDLEALAAEWHALNERVFGDARY